ncbi:MAG TPA: HAD family phosphatase [Pirellulales bacterium]|jgi:HAD superfamily hydrolase (TIGR01509 family)
MPPSKRLKAVVFDLDGLLFNTEELYNFIGAELLRRREKDFPPELLHQIMGRPQPVALQLMIDWHELDTTVKVLAAETEQLFAEILGHRLDFMPGAGALLAAIEAAGIPKAIATSSGRKFTRDILGRFQLEPRFQFILTCENITHGKPDPEIYLRAAEQFGIEPGEMMVLEDSQNGCRAAVAAGAYAIAVPSGPSAQHDFTGAALVANTLDDGRIYEALQIAPPC